MIVNKHIKKYFCFVCLFIYSFALIKPLTPLVKDAVAHTFYKMQHLATVHYENGKHHLHVELAEASDLAKDATSKGNTITSSEDIFQHFSNAILKIDNYPELCQILFTPTKQYTPGIFVEKSSPPPKA